MEFADELRALLPPDVPNREILIEKADAHLRMIADVNQRMNLTRITTVRDAVVKHVLDSVLPWRLFAGVRSVLDAGTGAGLPGVPLAIVLPETRFLLTDSVQKKAHFVDAVVRALALPNVEVATLRAEDLLRTRKFDVVTARAVAPLERAIEYFAKAFQSGSAALLYKGPDAEAEIAAAASALTKRGLRAQIRERYSLPDDLGSRTMVEIKAGR